jgi:hypothetical protein
MGTYDLIVAPGEDKRVKLQASYLECVLSGP